jgi:hypothetical protein
MHPLTLTALLVLVSLPPDRLYSQTPSNPGARQAAFESLRDSQWVRLSSPALGRRAGRLLQYTGADVVLSPEPLRIPATTIDTVWTRGRSSKAGAIVGAVLGAGLGVLAGNTFGEENAGSAKNILGLGGLGALAGSLVGVVIGTAIPRWHRRYP